MGKLHEVGKITVLCKGDGAIWLVSNIRPEFVKSHFRPTVEDFKYTAGVFETSSLQLKRMMGKPINLLSIYQKENGLESFSKFVMFRDGGFMIFESGSKHDWVAGLFDYEATEPLFAGMIEVVADRVHAFGSSISLHLRACPHGTDEKFIREHFGIPHPVKPVTQPIKAT